MILQETLEPVDNYLGPIRTCREDLYIKWLRLPNLLFYGGLLAVKSVKIKNL